MWRSRVREVWTSFWLLPALFVAAAVGLAVLLAWLDEKAVADLLPFLFQGGPDGARSVLSAISSSMISFTALVFSITIVVLQLTSGQFSPRVLRTFLQDRVTQVALGVFVATFVYALAVLRSVRGGPSGGEPFVPQLATTLSFVFVLASVVVFIVYIHHIANAIRVAQILESIGAQTRRLLEHRFRPDAPPPPVPPPSRLRATLPAPRPGVIAALHHERIVRAAVRADAVLVLVPRIGGYVPAGAPLFRVLDGPGGHRSTELDERAVTRAVDFAPERTMEQDVAFGFRQLADIAERALSPSVNDHTTAVQAIDQLHDLLRRLVSRPLPPRVHTDGDSRPRLVVEDNKLEHYLQVGVDDVGRWARDSPRVTRRLHDVLRDLVTAARPEHRPQVARRLPALDAAAGS